MAGPGGKSDQINALLTTIAWLGRDQSDLTSGDALEVAKAVINAFLGVNPDLRDRAFKRMNKSGNWFINRCAVFLSS